MAQLKRRIAARAGLALVAPLVAGAVIAGPAHAAAPVAPTGLNGVGTSVATGLNGVGTSVRTELNGAQVPTGLNGVGTSVATGLNGVGTSVRTELNGAQVWSGLNGAGPSAAVAGLGVVAPGDWHICKWASQC